jgi:hypothetical protein
VHRSYSIDTQLVTFKILVAIITRYPGLRQHFYDHKDLRNNENQSGIDFENLWRRQLQSCGEEWNFYRDLAAFCISENDLAKLVEADKPSEVAVVKLEDGNLNKVPIEILLGWCRSVPNSDLLNTSGGLDLHKDPDPNSILLESALFIISEEFWHCRASGRKEYLTKKGFWSSCPMYVAQSFNYSATRRQNPRTRLSIHLRRCLLPAMRWIFFAL